MSKALQRREQIEKYLEQTITRRELEEFPAGLHESFVVSAYLHNDGWSCCKNKPEMCEYEKYTTFVDDDFVYFEKKIDSTGVMENLRLARRETCSTRFFAAGGLPRCCCGAMCWACECGCEPRDEYKDESGCLNTGQCCGQDALTANNHFRRDITCVRKSEVAVALAGTNSLVLSEQHRIGCFQWLCGKGVRRKTVPEIEAQRCCCFRMPYIREAFGASGIQTSHNSEVYIDRSYAIEPVYLYLISKDQAYEVEVLTQNVPLLIKTVMRRENLHEALVMTKEAPAATKKKPKSPRRADK